MEKMRCGSDGEEERREIWEELQTQSVCDLRTRQNFLWANIVVTADQTQYRTFIFIVTEYDMQIPTELQPTKINRQQSFVAKAEHKLSLSYNTYPPGIFIIPALPIHFHCHKDLKPPSCF